MSVASPIIYTIGHSNGTTEEFLHLLDLHSIQVIVDVRSSPYSRYASHFSQAPLQKNLREQGLHYIYMGDAIGGVPHAPQFYDNEGHVLYAKIAATEAFQNAIERLIVGIRNYRVTLMCGEEPPEGCHRHHLIAKVLRKSGVAVMHIRGDGSLENDEDVARRNRLGTKDNPGQHTLFGSTSTPIEEWRSCKPVRTSSGLE
jgi:uncharacterized protein (DUF488 family)